MEERVEHSELVLGGDAVYACVSLPKYTSLEGGNVPSASERESGGHPQTLQGFHRYIGMLPPTYGLRRGKVEKLLQHHFIGRSMFRPFGRIKTRKGSGQIDQKTGIRGPILLKDRLRSLVRKCSDGMP